MHRKLLVAAFALTITLSAQDGWYSLFNGVDSTGWKIGGDPATFTIKDGVIIAKGRPAHFFYDGPVLNHVFKNFELKVDVMTEPNSNGGIYFHTEFQATGFPRKGFEVQVNNSYKSDPVSTGSLYHVQDINAEAIKDITKDGVWFTEHIIVQDNTVTIKLNDKQVVQWTQDAEWKGGREGAGRVIGAGTTFALQGHDPNSVVHYKNIRVKPLP